MRFDVIDGAGFRPSTGAEAIPTPGFKLQVLGPLAQPARSAVPGMVSLRLGTPSITVLPRGPHNLAGLGRGVGPGVGMHVADLDEQRRVFGTEDPNMDAGA